MTKVQKIFLQSGWGEAQYKDLSIKKVFNKEKRHLKTQ